MQIEAREGQALESEVRCLSLKFLIEIERQDIYPEATLRNNVRSFIPAGVRKKSGAKGRNRESTGKNNNESSK